MWSRSRPRPASPEQTPKRGGTVVVGLVGEPPCLSPLRAECGGFASVHGEGAGARRSSSRRLHAAAAARDQRDGHDEEPPFTVTFEIHPDARWSDGVPVTASGLRLHPRRDRRASPTARLQGPHRLVRSVAGRRREDREGRPASAHGRLAHPLLPRPAEHALRARTSRDLERRDRESAGRARRSGTARSFSQSWERGKQMTFVRNPRYWGPHTAYLDRIVLRFCRILPAATYPRPGARGSQAGRRRHRDHARPCDHPGAPEHSGGEGLRIPAQRRGLPPPPPRPRRASRAQGASSSAARSPTASTGRRSRARSSASSTRATRRATAPSS